MSVHTIYCFLTVDFPIGGKTVQFPLQQINWDAISHQQAHQKAFVETWVASQSAPTSTAFLNCKLALVILERVTFTRFLQYSLDLFSLSCFCRGEVLLKLWFLFLILLLLVSVRCKSPFEPTECYIAVELSCLICQILQYYKNCSLHWRPLEIWATSRISIYLMMTW